MAAQWPKVKLNRHLGGCGGFSCPGRAIRAYYLLKICNHGSKLCAIWKWREVWDRQKWDLEDWEISRKCSTRFQTAGKSCTCRECKRSVSSIYDGLQNGHTRGRGPNRYLVKIKCSQSFHHKTFTFLRLELCDHVMSHRPSLVKESEFFVASIFTRKATLIFFWNKFVSRLSLHKCHLRNLLQQISKNSSTILQQFFNDLLELILGDFSFNFRSKSYTSIGKDH